MKKSVGSKNRLFLEGAFLFVFLISLNSCTKSSMDNMTTGTDTGSKGSTTPGTNEVFIENMAFNPSVITINAGTTITWTNKDAVGHTVTSTTGLFDSGAINTNGIYSHLFSTAGSYPYLCTVHPSITGTVVVK
jgi:plastocyanin